MRSRSEMNINRKLLNLIMVLVASATIGALTSGCAYQYRTSTPQTSSSNVAAIYNEIMSGGANGASSTGSTSTLSASNPGLLNQDSTAVAYYVESDSARPVWSVLAFNNMGLLSSDMSLSSGQPVYAENSGIQHVDIIFVDGYQLDNSGNPVRSYELLMKMSDGQNNYYAVWDSVPGSDQFGSDGIFSVEMNPVEGNGSTLWLQSNDIDSSQDFNASIRLQVFDNSGQYAGQISTMTGFE